MHRAIKSNQEAWLKLYTDMNTELIKKAKNDFKKYFFQVDEYYSFWENHRKCEKT